MIPDMVRKKLDQRDLVMKNIRIVRESVDARKKDNIRFKQCTALWALNASVPTLIELPKGILKQFKAQK